VSGLASAQAIVESEVRELVRRRGLDPIAQADQVAGIVDEVIADYRDRAITAALPALGDVAATTRAVLTRWPGSGRCSRCSTTRRSRRSSWVG
jgi:pilus assembly protein CpaF